MQSFSFFFFLFVMGGGGDFGSGSGSKFNCAARVGSGQTISGTGRVRASVLSPCRPLPNYTLLSQYFSWMHQNDISWLKLKQNKMKHWAEYHHPPPPPPPPSCRPIFCRFSPLHKLNSQKVLFTLLSCFSNKTINYKTTI